MYLCAVIKRVAKYGLAVWFAVLLLIGNTPMDFIHLFADHVDTEHTGIEHKGPVFEKKHHHCAFLSLSLESFVNDYSVPVISFTPLVYFTVRTALYEHSVQRCIVAVSLRGPPAA
jgi:hypothetical protein